MSASAPVALVVPAKRSASDSRTRDGKRRIDDEKRNSYFRNQKPERNYTNVQCTTSESVDVPLLTAKLLLLRPQRIGAKFYIAFLAIRICRLTVLPPPATPALAHVHSDVLYAPVRIVRALCARHLHPA